MSIKCSSRFVSVKKALCKVKAAREIIRNVLIRPWVLSAKRTYFIIFIFQHEEWCLAHSQSSVGNDWMNEPILSPSLIPLTSSLVHTFESLGIAQIPWLEIVQRVGEEGALLEVQNLRHKVSRTCFTRALLPRLRHLLWNLQRGLLRTSFHVFLLEVILALQIFLFAVKASK